MFRFSSFYCICFDLSLTGYGSVDYRFLQVFLLRFRNDTGKDLKLSSKCVAYLGVGPAKLDADPSADFTIKHKKTGEIDGEVVKDGTSREFRHEDVPLWPGNINIFNADVSAGGKPILRRRIAWDLNKGLKFVDPVFRTYLRSAFFP